MPIEEMSSKHIKSELKKLKPGEVDFSIFDTVLADANGRAILADNPDLCKEFWQFYRDMIETATNNELAYSRHFFLAVTREQFVNGLTSSLLIDKFNVSSSKGVIPPKTYEELAHLIQQNEAQNKGVQDFSNYVSFPKQIGLSNQLDILTEPNFAIRCLKIDRNLRILKGAMRANDDNLALGRRTAISQSITRLKEIEFLSTRAKRILKAESEKRDITSLLKGKYTSTEILPMMSIFRSAINSAEEQEQRIKEYRRNIKEAIRKEVIEKSFPLANELLLEVGEWHKLTKSKSKNKLEASALDQVKLDQLVNAIKDKEKKISDKKEIFLKKMPESERASLENLLDIILYDFLGAHFSTSAKSKELTAPLLLEYGVNFSAQMLNDEIEYGHKKIMIIKLFLELQREHRKKDKSNLLEMPLEYQTDTLLARLEAARALLSEEHQEKIADDYFSADAITHELSTSIQAIGKQREICEEDKNAWKEIRALKKSSFYKTKSRSNSLSDSPAYKHRKSGVKGSVITRSNDLLEKATAALNPAAVQYSQSMPPSMAASHDTSFENTATILSSMTTASLEIKSEPSASPVSPPRDEEQPAPARRSSAPKVLLDSNLGRLWKFHTDCIEQHQREAVPLKSPGRSATSTPRSARSNSCTTSTSSSLGEDVQMPLESHRGSRTLNPFRVNSDGSLNESPRIVLGDPCTPRERKLSMEKVNPVYRGAPGQVTIANPVYRGASDERMNSGRNRSSSTEKDGSQRATIREKAVSLFTNIGRSRSPSDGDASPSASSSSSPKGEKKMDKVVSVPRLTFGLFSSNRQKQAADAPVTPPSSSPPVSKKGTPRYRSAIRRGPSGSSGE